MPISSADCIREQDRPKVTSGQCLAEHLASSHTFSYVSAFQVFEHLFPAQQITTSLCTMIVTLGAIDRSEPGTIAELKFAYSMWNQDSIQEFLFQHHFPGTSCPMVVASFHDSTRASVLPQDKSLVATPGALPSGYQPTACFCAMSMSDLPRAE